MSSSALERANKLSRKHNHRMWAEKQRVTRGMGAAAGATASANATPLDFSKAIWRPAPPAIVAVPAAGTISIGFTGWENGDLTPLYHQLTAGTFTGWQADANYVLEVSVLCSLTTGTGVQLGVEVWINGVVYQEIIRHWITTVDERHNGQTTLHVLASPSDVVDIRFSDPGGAGYSVTVQEVFVDWLLGNRR